MSPRLTGLCEQWGAGISRVPRYVLLLQSLEKETPEAHSGLRSLRRAIGLIKDVAKFIDQTRGQWTDQQEYEEQLLKLTVRLSPDIIYIYESLELRESCRVDPKVAR